MQVISTLAGTQHHRATWKPMPCSGSLALEEAQLSWPTELAISPLDSTLHIIDDDTVLQLTKDGRVRVAAGRPLHCHASQYQIPDKCFGPSIDQKRESMKKIKLAKWSSIGEKIGGGVE